MTFPVPQPGAVVPVIDLNARFGRERFLILLNLTRVLTWQELAALGQLSATRVEAPGLAHS